jgi:hypothetical protein
MDRLADIEQRIDRMCEHASAGLVDVTPSDVQDLLDEGYIYALKADAMARRLHARLDECLGDAEGRADEARRIAREKRALERSTRRLRGRLQRLRSLSARSAARAGSG